MPITRPTRSGMAILLLAGMLAGGPAEPASAAVSKCKGRDQALVNGHCVTNAYQPPDRQLESRGYRRRQVTTVPYQPPDRQLESRGYRHYKGHRAKAQADQ
jgi:hypothetical protein